MRKTALLEAAGRVKEHEKEEVRLASQRLFLRLKGAAPVACRPSEALWCGLLELQRDCELGDAGAVAAAVRLTALILGHGLQVTVRSSCATAAITSLTWLVRARRCTRAVAQVQLVGPARH